MIARVPRALPRSFYDRPTLTVARELLGCVLVCRSRGRIVSGYITETEAYIGHDDPASHASRGMTPRTALMFDEPGFAYVYFVYGMYWCLNVVTEAKGFPAAVLIRGVWPKQGTAVMARRRFGAAKVTILQSKNIANGPGKLCNAFGIDGGYNGTDLSGHKLFITKGMQMSDALVKVSGRVGIKAATEYPWRFHIEDAAAVFEKR